MSMPSWWRKEFEGSSVLHKCASCGLSAEDALRNLNDAHEALVERLTERAMVEGVQEAEAGAKVVPERWISLYVKQLCDLAGKLGPDSPMGRAALLRADHAIDLVKAHRETGKR